MQTIGKPFCTRDCDNCAGARTCPLARLAELLDREAGVRVCVIENDWDRVDAARAEAQAAGVADRVSVHHASVLELCA